MLNILRSGKKAEPPATRTFLTVDESAPPAALSSAVFGEILRMEQKRAERSSRRLVLMLVECPEFSKSGEPSDAVTQIQSALFRSMRMTDIMGWYRGTETLGIIFTEFAIGETTALEMFSGKVSAALRETLGAERADRIQLSVRTFPE